MPDSAAVKIKLRWKFDNLYRCWFCYIETNAGYGLLASSHGWNWPDTAMDACKLLTAMAICFCTSGCGAIDEDAVDSSYNVGAAIGGIPNGGITVVSPDIIQGDRQPNLENYNAISISFDLPVRVATLSLCTGYDVLEGQGITVDVDGCVLHTEVTNGSYYAQNINLHRSVTTMLVVLIDTNNPTYPFFTEFSVNPDRTTLYWQDGTSL